MRGAEIRKRWGRVVAYLALGTTGILATMPGLARSPAPSSQVPYTPLISAVQKALSSNGRCRVLQVVKSDLDKDHRTEYLAITFTTMRDGHPLGGEVAVLRSTGGKLRVLWRQGGLNPWKLLVGDVDGDGKPDIAVGVWKKSPFDPVMAKRSFFYWWNGHRLMPKWLGSRLSRRFDDFTLADVNGDRWDELLALERAPDGKHRVSVYRWRSFGFDWLGCSPELKGLVAFKGGLPPRVTTSTGAELTVRYKSGRVSLVRG